MANPITDEKWQAILGNDANYNNQFLYGVKTTGIFCRPSCKSRPPKKENVLIFLDAQEAISAHFRPCKRCKPTGERLPDHEWVAIITGYIEDNYKQKLTLEILATIAHGSPYHLQRTFKRIKGMTPVEYIQNTRINKAKEYLLFSEKSIADISREVGIQNPSYFISLFKKNLGLTPSQYREK